MGQPQEKGKGSKKKEKGDIQVGPDVRTPAAPAKKASRESASEQAPGAQGAESPQPPPSIAKPVKGAPGIFPVYQSGNRWLLMDRGAHSKAKSRLSEGAQVLVVGSQGVDVFRIGRSSWSWGAACADRRPSRTLAWWVSGGRKAAYARVGVPIVAIQLKPGARFDLSQALFYPLRNEVKDTVYQKLDFAIRKVNTEELRSGEFAINAGDQDGKAFARDPDPLRLLMKIDFGSKIRVKGLRDPFLLVEGTQVSNTYRRCLRLFEAKSPLGGCVHMPHVLMTETREMSFVAYDPARGGSPFVFAYTTSEPLWGHERWGFRLSAEKADLFLRDALDPRCRENF